MALQHPWTTPPAIGMTIDVAPGVAWLRMPLPFQLDHINLWLLDDGDGFTVVDTGAGLPPTRAAWETIFTTRLGGKPITRIVVTHFHPDHIGNAAWLAERWHAPVVCTDGEGVAAQQVWFSSDPAEWLEHWRRHGLGGDALAALSRRGNHYPGLVPKVPARWTCLRDGDVLTIGDDRWEIFTMGGHAPEHACLWCPGLRVLISGDQVLPKITTNVSVWSREQADGNPLRTYLESLRRFDPLPADTLVLPSHGGPFRGLPERLAALRAHHDARLAECAGALTEARTPAEIVPLLFRRALDAHHLSFAMGETLAHLYYLEAEGRAARAVGPDGLVRFRKA
ncbi:MAG: MBL fold metallo-hydrolase [Candidatus Rokubacteria bacterium]|nr:MBL fold metallo-hydrolase [Candidatus Rokubacteria bacterium]